MADDYTFVAHEGVGDFELTKHKFLVDVFGKFDKVHFKPAEINIFANRRI